VSLRAFEEMGCRLQFKLDEALTRHLLCNAVSAPAQPPLRGSPCIGEFTGSFYTCNPVKIGRSCRASEILDTALYTNAYWSLVSLGLMVEKDDALWGFGVETQATDALPLVARLDPGSHAPFNVLPATHI
jgi:hypothetical protein